MCIITRKNKGYNMVIKVKGLEKINQKIKSKCCKPAPPPWPPFPPCPTKCPNPPAPTGPVDNCQVHFSGVLISDNAKAGWFSKIYTVDIYSELVGAGDYPDNTKAFPKAVKTTFDGIVIDHGVRLQIFSGKNYGGDLAIDVIGPMIINNRIYNYELNKEGYGNREFTPSNIQAKYPIKNRYVNKKSIDILSLSFGSCKISCGHDPANSLNIGVELFKT